MSLRNITTLLICVATLSACAEFDVSEATHILNGPTYPPLSDNSVVIYITEPKFEYSVIGIVEARGMSDSIGEGTTLLGFIKGTSASEARDQELAIKALKNEAAKIGADGVIINASSQEIAGISQAGTSTERRIKALAIRRK